MEQEELESISIKYVELNKQIKTLKKIANTLKSDIKKEMKDTNKEFIDIKNVRIVLTKVKQDRLDKDKVVIYVDKTGGNISELYKHIEFDRLDVVETSDSLEMVNIDL